MAGGGEPFHIGADLGQDHARGGGVDAGDLIQPLCCCGERGDHLLDPAVERGDVSVDGIDPGQHLGQQEGVVIGEVAGERFLQCGDLAAHRGPCHLRQHPRVTLAGDQRRQHLPAGDPEDVRGDHAQLDLGFSELKMIKVLPGQMGI